MPETQFLLGPVSIFTPTGCCHHKLPCRPLALVQEGGGDEEGLTTGAKADFCFTAADTMLAGEKEKTPEEEEQLEGSEVEEAIVGLEGTTGGGEK